ncbi:MAG: 6,7-dimethyl-8-ribityllumazine synthase [Chitinophagales bacterium]|nr:6,7-dimethyl-8-ribityllumazine synthase [Bacteroidota bacterium]MCB9044021.1 6,7-dimethyl-8-ribityllumazine synthase [Chitinophagales bacterium]
MATQHSDKPTKLPSATGFRFGIVVSDWNETVTHALLAGATETLCVHAGVPPSDVIVKHVPGSFELPLAAQWLAENSFVDAIICLGCVVTGETRHDHYINSAVAQGIMQLNLKLGIPFIFGVLTPQTQQQALDRAGGKHGNKGSEAAETAVRMLVLRKEMST